MTTTAETIGLKDKKKEEQRPWIPDPMMFGQGPGPGPAPPMMPGGPMPPGPMPGMAGITMTPEGPLGTSGLNPNNPPALPIPPETQQAFETAKDRAHESDPIARNVPQRTDHLFQNPGHVAWQQAQPLRDELMQGYQGQDQRLADELSLADRMDVYEPPSKKMNILAALIPGVGAYLRRRERGKLRDLGLEEKAQAIRQAGHADRQKSLQEMLTLQTSQPPPMERPFAISPRTAAYQDPTTGVTTPNAYYRDTRANDWENATGLPASVARTAIIAGENPVNQNTHAELHATVQRIIDGLATMEEKETVLKMDRDAWDRYTQILNRLTQFTGGMPNEMQRQEAWKQVQLELQEAGRQDRPTILPGPPPPGGNPEVSDEEEAAVRRIMEEEGVDRQTAAQQFYSGGPT